MSDDLDRAWIEGEVGMSVAADAADRRIPGWTEMAYHYLVQFATTHPYFISEDVSNTSKEERFPQPRTDRAWGSIIDVQ